METPMQELIRHIDVLIESTSTNHYKSIKEIIVNNYLEKEKQVIIEAYSLASWDSESPDLDGEQYYKENFK